ncbi:hypothetical protein KUTeg_004824 [Tegillarca granosa]|uniref:Class II aldolase/adducin N-terminal domain-containing protein n=1 Tax=Tegillarca granosa TaxID=220873 RepID=A0ABQ9FML3_TEGGR|nr:hypothetical protein KUTeg_004824 [Tegillarca granosa]
MGGLVPGCINDYKCTDPDDPNYQRELMRPADVKEDVRQMSEHRRVSLILNSEAFRKELEEIVDEQIKSGPHPASLLALQQITELLLPHSRLKQGLACPVIPISDIKGSDSLNYCKGEKLVRCKAAALYRLIDMHGWGHGIYNHISVRINQEQEHFLINPFGVLYSEISASTLVKIDMQGEVVDPGSTTLGINKAGFTLHSAIHQARPDIKCIIHLHTPAAVAVSIMKCGFLPISQEALICGEVSYHEYNGILVDQAEKDTIQRNLGPINKVMFLRNHGVVACGETINAIPAGVDNLVLVDTDIRKKTFNVASQGGGGVDTGGKKWKTGELEFEAWMRQLDNAGYKTGYVYKQPIVKQETRKDRLNSDVEVPPASSSFTYVFDGDYEHSKYMSPLKVALERQKQHYKAGWLNSPNTYIKQEWVQEEAGSPNKKGTTSIKIENPNQFAPQGTNPKEYKEKQKSIRKDYYEDKISAGPTSKVLEGISWEEAQKLQAEGKLDGTLSMTGDQVIVIGAASKGIIQRDQQHNVQVYKSQYAANPFETMTEDEIQKYKIEVEKKKKGDDSVTEEQLSPGPDGKLVSSDERIQIIQQKPEPVPEKEEATRYVSRTKRPSKETNIDDILDPYIPPPPSNNKSDKYNDHVINGDEKMSSPAKSDTLKSTDSASGGETLEDRSSKEGSPTKELPSPSKEKHKKKKKFRMPSFSKTKKNKESKESTI